MKKPIIFSIVLCLCFSLSACSNQQAGTKVDDSYLEGVDNGHYEVFEDLWSTSSSTKYLSWGETWETSHFALTVKNVVYEGNPSVKFTLQSNGLSMEQCFEDSRMTFYAFAESDEYRKLFVGDDFYWYAVIQGLSEYSGQAITQIYDDEEAVLIVIVVEGKVYKAKYYC